MRASSPQDKIHRYKQKIRRLEDSLAALTGKDRALVSSWDAYRAIFETTGTATFIMEEDFTISLVNTEFERLSGYSCDEIEEKKSFLQFLAAKQDAGQVVKYHRLRLRCPQNVPRQYEIQFVGASGKVINALLTGAIIPGTHKSVISLLDITQNKEAARDLQLAEAKYRTIFDNSAAAITMTDAKERIISWNKFAQDMLGMDKTDLHLRKVKTLYPVNEWKKIRAYNVRRKGMQHHLETKIIRKDSSVIDVDISLSVLKDEDGAVTGSIGIIRDITERKIAEAALREKEKQLKKALSAMRVTNVAFRKTQDLLIQSEKMAIIGQLSVGIAHEVKNPLAIILQAADAIDGVMARLGAQDAKRYTSMARNAAERANKVIIELLNFARPTQTQLKPINLHEVIDRAIDLVANKAKMENIGIKREYSGEPHLVRADSILMEDVFLNLVTNAIEAGCRNITVKTQCPVESTKFYPRGSLVVELVDDGEGISQENLAHLFEPFFTTKEEGTGLGLALVDIILKKHNGTISAESKKGEGTRFIVTLPLESNVNQPEAS